MAMAGEQAVELAEMMGEMEAAADASILTEMSAKETAGLTEALESNAPRPPKGLFDGYDVADEFDDWADEFDFNPGEQMEFNPGEGMEEIELGKPSPTDFSNLAGLGEEGQLPLELEGPESIGINQPKSGIRAGKLLTPSMKKAAALAAIVTILGGAGIGADAALDPNSPFVKPKIPDRHPLPTSSPTDKPKVEPPVVDPPVPKPPVIDPPAPDPSADITPTVDPAPSDDTMTKPNKGKPNPKDKDKGIADTPDTGTSPNPDTANPFTPAPTSPLEDDPKGTNAPKPQDPSDPANPFPPKSIPDPDANLTPEQKHAKANTAMKRAQQLTEGLDGTTQSKKNAESVYDAAHEALQKLKVDDPGYNAAKLANDSAAQQYMAAMSRSNIADARAQHLARLSQVANEQQQEARTDTTVAPKTSDDYFTPPDVAPDQATEERTPLGPPPPPPTASTGVPIPGQAGLNGGVGTMDRGASYSLAQAVVHVAGKEMEPSLQQKIVQELMYRSFNQVSPNGWLGNGTSIYVDTVRNHEQIRMHNDLATPRKWEPNHGIKPIYEALAPSCESGKIKRAFSQMNQKGSRIGKLLKERTVAATALPDDINHYQPSSNLPYSKPSPMRFSTQTEHRPLRSFDPAGIEMNYLKKDWYDPMNHPFENTGRRKKRAKVLAQSASIYLNHNDGIY